MAIDASELPPELQAAQAELAGCDGLYFAPVRHHSPACTLALRHLLREVQPSVVLVEGPDDLDHLLPLLQDEATRAPVAWLCQSRQAAAGRDEAAAEDEDDAGDDEAEGHEMRTSFFPFCDYSPEWLAIREGAALGAQVALIDLPWAHKAWQAEHDDAGLSLMHERHYAHSRYLKAMAGRLGCVDHHELWDRLFELRSPAALADWRGFFADVFAWSAMARQDYEPEVLEAELSLPRERQMAAHIRAWREKCTGNIVVVTGGFHTQELISSWRQAGRPEKLQASASAEGGAWLIRYSYASLDALNGYSAGMPSPAYYQQLWDALQTTDDYPWQRIAVDLLSRFARQQRAADQAGTEIEVGPGLQMRLDADPGVTGRGDNNDDLQLRPRRQLDADIMDAAGIDADQLRVFGAGRHRDQPRRRRRPQGLDRLQVGIAPGLELSGGQGCHAANPS